jgi:hypothetical protein
MADRRWTKIVFIGHRLLVLRVEIEMRGRRLTVGATRPYIQFLSVAA